MKGEQEREVGVVGVEQIQRAKVEGIVARDGREERVRRLYFSS